MTREALFPTDFLARLAALRWDSRRAGERAGGSVLGSRPAASGFEIRGFRPYAPGDDPRGIDWAALARWDEAVVRQFGDAASRELVVLLDRSPSMRFGTPSKEVLARRLAGAFGAMAISAGRRARLAGEGAAAADARGWLAIVAGARATESLLPREAADELAQGGRREWILLTDRYDVEALSAAMDRARRRGDPMTLVATLSRGDVEPPASSTDVVDAETGEARWYTTADAAEFRRRRDAFEEAWEARCQRLSVPMARVFAERPWEEGVGAVLEARARAEGRLR